MLNSLIDSARGILARVRTACFRKRQREETVAEDEAQESEFRPLQRARLAGDPDSLAPRLTKVPEGGCAPTTCPTNENFVQKTVKGSVFAPSRPPGLVQRPQAGNTAALPPPSGKGRSSARALHERVLQDGRNLLNAHAPHASTPGLFGLSLLGGAGRARTPKEQQAYERGLFGEAGTLQTFKGMARPGLGGAFAAPTPSASPFFRREARWAGPRTPHAAAERGTLARQQAWSTTNYRVASPPQPNDAPHACTVTPVMSHFAGIVRGTSVRYKCVLLTGFQIT
jgi:hypothetical protein